MVGHEWSVTLGRAWGWLHVSTFGSDDRARDRKSSQSLQLNVDQARELVAIIERTFPGTRPASTR